MQKETLIKFLARLEAIETLVAVVLSGQYLDANFTVDDVTQTHVKLLKKFSERGYSGADPAFADHWAAEVEESIGRILTRAEQLFSDTVRRESG